MESKIDLYKLIFYEPFSENKQHYNLDTEGRWS